MDQAWVLVKQYYQLKRQIDKLGERDRLLVLIMVSMGIIFLWFVLLCKPQLQSMKSTKDLINSLNSQISAVEQKSLAITNLVGSNTTESLIQHLETLKVKMQDLDKQILRYQHRYISGKELGKLLHDMLHKTYGVVIEDFSTKSAYATPLIQQKPAENSQSTTDTSKAAPESDNKTVVGSQETGLSQTDAIHYKLVLRGTYFAIIKYLQRLEELSWAIYWDKFDYSVKNYPEGVATIEFYTLIPHSAAAVEGSLPKSTNTTGVQ